MIKLDLGAGVVSPPGFRPVGRDHGSEIFPLPYPDESVDEIRASHCLEHFGHRQIEAVLKDWVRALKKGGRIRIAVPDFEIIARDYLSGMAQPHEHYLLGGQIDANDHHGSLFDRERLRLMLAAEGLVLIGPWTSEIADCAAYPISLNLEAYKPHLPEIKVSGAMSVPRAGFMDNFFCTMEACLPCHVKLRKHGGAFWGQAMENVFERILEEDEADYILAIDYDSAFLPRHLARLMQTVMLFPEIDALAPLQSSRHMKTTLFTVQGTEGNEPSIPRTAFSGETTPVSTAHFGLTLIKAEKLRALPKPWFHATPSPAGDWHEGKVDDDINFWRAWGDAGNSLHLANRVAIGHMELMVRWPDINLEVMYQSTKDFQISGVPEGVWGMTVAFVTGATGQDGSYLCELLLSKGYEVHGLVRRISQPNLSNLAAVLGKITLHTGDMTDGPSLFRVLQRVRPDEIYNLAGMSQVRDSYDHPEVTQDINAQGLLRILESCRTLCLDAKVYQACSSEMFGKVAETPQTETTRFHPRSPYGSSKVAAFEHARTYREAYGMKVYCGILFNHESPRRGPAFLSRKVCTAVAEIANGRRDKLVLGNLSAKRDWGYAPEYVEWIHRIMQHPTPDDFVIATGETHSVEEFVAAAFAHVGITDWQAYVDYDQGLTRPAEVDLLCGDASKSKRVLGFEPKVKFAELVGIMVDAEMAKLSTTHEDERRSLRSFPEAKLITVKKDCIIGGHYHLKKDEHFILSEGGCRMFVGRDPDVTRTWMERGKLYTVPAGTPHWFHIQAGSVLVGLNSQPYDPSDDYAVELTEQLEYLRALAA